jgi:hypothetical protein
MFSEIDKKRVNDDLQQFISNKFYKTVEFKKTDVRSRIGHIAGAGPFTFDYEAK